MKDLTLGIALTLLAWLTLHLTEKRQPRPTQEDTDWLEADLTGEPEPWEGEQAGEVVIEAGPNRTNCNREA